MSHGNSDRDEGAHNNQDEEVPEVNIEEIYSTKMQAINQDPVPYFSRSCQAKCFKTEIRVKLVSDGDENCEYLKPKYVLALLDSGADGVFIKEPLIKGIKHGFYFGDINIHGCYKTQLAKEHGHFTYFLPDFKGLSFFRTWMTIKPTTNPNSKYGIIFGGDTMERMKTVLDYNKKTISIGDQTINMSAKKPISKKYATYLKSQAAIDRALKAIPKKPNSIKPPEAATVNKDAFAHELRNIIGRKDQDLPEFIKSETSHVIKNMNPNRYQDHDPDKMVNKCDHLDSYKKIRPQETF